MNRREMIDSSIRDIVRVLPSIVAVATGVRGLPKLIKSKEQGAVVERPKCFPAPMTVPSEQEEEELQ